MVFPLVLQAHNSNKNRTNTNILFISTANSVIYKKADFCSVRWNLLVPHDTRISSAPRISGFFLSFVYCLWRKYRLFLRVAKKLHYRVFVWFKKHLNLHIKKHQHYKHIDFALFCSTLVLDKRLIDAAIICAIFSKYNF